jgi:hypothetical protein
LRHRNTSKEEGGERGGTSGLHHLLTALREEAEATEDVFVPLGATMGVAKVGTRDFVNTAAPAASASTSCPPSTW